MKGTVWKGLESISTVELGGAVVLGMHQHGLDGQSLAGDPGPLQAVEKQDAPQALSLVSDCNGEPGDQRDLNRISREALAKLAWTILESDLPWCEAIEAQHEFRLVRR